MTGIDSKSGRGLRRVVGALALALAVLPGVALALSDFDLVVEGAGGKGLAESLREVSLLRAAVKDGTEDPREVVALGQNEYLNLLEALYAKGYYSAVISVRLDGREAAEIPVGAEPRAVSSAKVTVQTGPRFDFGRAQIAPVRAEGALPEAFQPGKPARARAVRDAANSVVRSWKEAGYAKAEVARQDIVARHSEARLDAAIEVDPGPAPALRRGDGRRRDECEARARSQDRRAAGRGGLQPRGGRARRAQAAAHGHVPLGRP